MLKNPRKPSRFCRLLKADTGATAMEFALIAPVLFLLIMGILEFGVIMFTMSVVEGVTSMTARIGKTGYAETGGAVPSRAEYLKNEFYRRSGHLFDIKKLHICSSNTASFTGAGLADNPYIVNGHCTADNVGDETAPADDSISAGSGNRVALYTVTYEWQIMTPLLLPFFLNNPPPLRSDTAYITAISTVKNEGF